MKSLNEQLAEAFKRRSGIPGGHKVMNQGDWGAVIVDLRDRIPVVDDRPQEHAAETSKKPDTATNPEVAGYRAYLGKDKG
jgi:hypothetical protein